MRIVPARPDDAAALTAMAFAAKRHWGYPEKWIESWRHVLTINAEFLATHETHVAMIDERPAGFYALDGRNAKADLLHLWVWPEAMGRGIGRALFLHAVERARALGFREMEIESDPNAEKFYEHMGARRIGSRVRKVEGQPRELPVLVYGLD